MENYWFNYPINNDWHREVGDLKCSACGRITRHALLNPANDSYYRDHAEVLQQLALGFSNNGHFSEERLSDIRRAYRQAFPRNPFTRHKWWRSDEDAARAAGHTQFPAMCGEMLDVPEKRYPGGDVTELRAPSQINDLDELNFERLDVETGMYWDVGDCVNCLAYRNAWLVNKRREELKYLFIKMAASTESLDAAQVQKIWSVLQEIPCDR
ncbi:hypothetical protein [Mycolicibacterium litorale]|nr:hypothetical protein [Mycolicibacterium litorale]MCV7417787.1 hypothetical protein [Mycolicibacterium litorale]